MSLTGLDASRHQGTIDFQAVARAGHSFAFLKLTDDTWYRYVNWFHIHAPLVRAAGLVLGAYHFLSAKSPGDAQARYYVSEMHRFGSFDGVVPIVDIERNSDGSTPGIGVLRAFVAEFRRLVPGRPILIYTGHWYWVGVIGDPYGADLGPLWHSEYDGISPIDEDVANGPERDAYGGWRNCLVWQHTSSGSCPGVAGLVDLNIFYGSMGDLLALAGTPQEDTLSATEVAEIKAHITAEADRVIHETWDSRPYFAADYTRQAELGEDVVWVVFKQAGIKMWVPQPGETPEEQEAPGKAFLLDRVFSNGVFPNDYPRAWDRPKAHLDLYVTVGPVPPGWETRADATDAGQA